jgi:hypothetical protein
MKKLLAYTAIGLMVAGLFCVVMSGCFIEYSKQIEVTNINDSTADIFYEVKYYRNPVVYGVFSGVPIAKIDSMKEVAEQKRDSLFDVYKKFNQ